MAGEPERNQEKKTIRFKLKQRVMNFLEWIARAEKQSPACTS